MNLQQAKAAGKRTICTLNVQKVGELYRTIYGFAQKIEVIDKSGAADTITVYCTDDIFAVGYDEIGKQDYRVKYKGDGYVGYPIERREIMTQNSLAVFDPVKAEMAKYREQNANLVFDYEDPDDNKLARSHVYGLRKIKTRIATAHKNLKAEALAFCREVDSEKRDLTTEVEGWIEHHAKPIKEIDERERVAQEAKAEAERLEAERVEAERLETIRKQEEAMADEAARVQAEKDKLAREKEKFEADKLAEADARRRVEQEHQRADREKQEAIALAEQEKLAAVEAEKEKARKVEADRLAKIEAEKAEQARLAEIEQKRVENQEHRKSIENLVASGIALYVNDTDEVKKLLKAIVDGCISNLTIKY